MIEVLWKDLDFNKIPLPALKKSYVDVFNPSGAPMKAADNILAPSTVPTIPQGGFFIPGAAPMGQPQQQQQQQF